MSRFDFQKSLFTLLEEEHVSFYSGPYWSNYGYEMKKRRIHYENKPLVFTFPGERICQNGIRVKMV